MLPAFSGLLHLLLVLASNLDVSFLNKKARAAAARVQAVFCIGAKRRG